jgi:hypothetical protein
MRCAPAHAAPTSCAEQQGGPRRAASACRGQRAALWARRELRTSVPGIWAAGDCCTVRPEAQAPLWFQMRLWTQARPGRRARAHRQPARAGRAWPWIFLVRSGHARLLRSLLSLSKRPTHTFSSVTFVISCPLIGHPTCIAYYQDAPPAGVKARQAGLIKQYLAAQA